MVVHLWCVTCWRLSRFEIYQDAHVKINTVRFAVGVPECEKGKVAQQKKAAVSFPHLNLLVFWIWNHSNVNVARLVPNIGTSKLNCWIFPTYLFESTNYNSINQYYIKMVLVVHCLTSTVSRLPVVGCVGVKDMNRRPANNLLTHPWSCLGVDASVWLPIFNSISSFVLFESKHMLVIDHLALSLAIARCIYWTFYFHVYRLRLRSTRSNVMRLIYLIYRRFNGIHRSAFLWTMFNPINWVYLKFNYF